MEKLERHLISKYQGTRYVFKRHGKIVSRIQINKRMKMPVEKVAAKIG
ncbi:MAG: hypothetical protein AB7V25_00335 [Mangrovibacterium sp.]